MGWCVTCTGMKGGEQKVRQTEISYSITSMEGTESSLTLKFRRMREGNV